MTSLTKCLQKAGKALTVREKNEIKKLQEDYILDGFTPAEAANQAIVDTMESLEADYSAVADQIREQNGVVPDKIVDQTTAEETIAQGRERREKSEQEAAKKKKQKEAAAEKRQKAKEAKRKAIERKKAAKKKFTRARAEKLGKLIKARGMRVAAERLAVNPKAAHLAKDPDKLKAMQKAVNVTVDVTYPKQTINPTLAADFIENGEALFNDPNLSGKQAFQKMVSELDENDPLRLVAEMIMPSIPDNVVVMPLDEGDRAPLHVVNGLENSDAYAMTNVVQGDAPYIVLRGPSFGSTSGLTYSTVIHEMIHVALQDQISVMEQRLEVDPNDSLSDFPKPMVDAFNDLKVLQAKVLADKNVTSQLSQMQLAEMANIHEFITYGLTYPQVAEVFKQTTYKNSGKNLWTDFVQALGRMLGITKAEDMNLFMTVAGLTEQMVQADFRQQVKEQEKLLGFTSGKWYDNEKASKDTTVKPKRKVEQMQRQAIPLKVVSFDVNDATGSPAWGMHLTADDFVGDVYQQLETAESQTLLFEEEAISEQLIEMFDKNPAAATVVYYALQEAVDFKLNSKASLSAKNLALEIFNNSYGQAADSQQYANFIRGLDFDQLSVRVATSPTNIDFYKDQYLLEKIGFDSMTQGERLAVISNPTKMYNDVVMAKIKLGRPKFWKAYTDYLYEATTDIETGEVVESLDLYDFAVKHTGSPEKASKLLNSVGVHGMVSTDSVSYVLFDEAKIKQILNQEKKTTELQGVLSTGAVIGEVTADDRKIHSQLIEKVDDAQTTLENMARYGLSDTEQQTLSLMMNLLKSSMRAFASKKDNSKTFMAMLKDVNDKLADAEKLANSVFSEIKAANKANPFSEVSRMLLKDLVIAQVTELDVYTPLQKRIADILMAGLSDNYTLAAQRAQALSQDLKDGDVASAMVSGQRSASGRIVPVQDFLGGIAEMTLSKKQTAQTIRGGSIAQLREDIPNKDRVFKKPLSGSAPITKEDGTRFIDGDLNQKGVGLEGLGMTAQDFQDIWDIAVESSSPATQKVIKTKGIKGPVRPKDFEFWNRALQLEDQARYWYEISTESMRETLSELTPEQMEMFFMVVGATSPQANPHDNMRRAISIMGNLAADRPAMTAIAKGIGDKGGVVRSAVMSQHAETNKVHNFAGTFLYLAGYTPDAPLSTNDRQVAFSFNMKPTDLFANQNVYYTLSQFYLGLAEALNARLPEGAEPYQAWQLQALGWVQERLDAPGGSNTNDDYMMALERIRNQASEAGIIPEGGAFTNEVLADERLQGLVDQTTPAFMDAKKTTIEVYSERSAVTKQYEFLKDYVDQKVKWKNRVQAAIRRSARALVKRDQVNKVASVPSRLMTALTGRKTELTRLDYGDGTYKGNANLNLRIPLPGKDQQHMKRVVAAFNEGLNQFLSPASNYQSMDLNDTLPEGATETTQIFVPDAVEVNLEELSQALPNEWEISVSYVPNGVVIDVAPDFESASEPFGMLMEEANDFFSEHLRMKNDRTGDWQQPDKFNMYRSAFTGIYSAKNDTKENGSAKSQAEMRAEYNQAKKDATAAAMAKLKKLVKVKPDAGRRFLEGSDQLIRDNKNNDKLINNLYNIRNEYSMQMSWTEDSSFAVNDAYNGIYADGVDQLLKVIPDAKIKDIKTYLQGQGEPAASWSTQQRQRAARIRTAIDGRIASFRGAFESIQASLEQQQDEINDVLTEVKQEFGQEIYDSIIRDPDSTEDITPIDPVEMFKGLSLSLNMRTPTSEAYFEREQLNSEIALAEQARDNRTDINAGRKLKELREQFRVVQQSLTNATKTPQFEEGSFGAELDEVLGRIVAPSEVDLTIKERLQNFTASWLSKAGWSDRLKDWYQSGVASAAAVERMEKEIVAREGGKGPRMEGNKSPTVLTYQAMNASVSSSIAIHHHGLKLEQGQLVIDENIKGLERIIEPLALQGNKYIKLFEGYLVAKRAERLLLEDKENFVLDSDIQAIFDYVNPRPNLKAAIETAAAEYAALNKSVLEVAIRSGYINREDAFGGQYAEIIDSEGNVVKTIQGERGTMLPLELDLESQMEQMLLDMDKPNLSYKVYTQDGWYHDDYVPFNRVNELDGKTKDRGQGGGKVGQVRKGVIGLKGGIGAISVLENMSNNINFLITGSMKTMAMRSIQSYAGTQVMEKIETTGEAPLIDSQTAKTLLDEMNIDFDSLNTAEKQRWVRMLSRARPFDNDVVVVYRNGRPEYYRVMDHSLLNSLKNIGPREVHRILDFLGMITRTLTKSITIMPSFLVRNFVRETQNTFILNDKAFNPLRTLLTALRNVGKLARDPKKTKVMLEMMAAGSVSYNNYFDVTPAAIRKRLNNMAQDRSAFKKVVGSAADFFRLYYRLAVASEHANRLQVRNDYIAARTKELGGNLSAADQATVTAEANHRALDIMNFSRRGGGAIADVAIAVLPFINPRIQGMDRLLRGAKWSKKQYSMKLGTMAIAASVLAMINWEENEEEMEKLKDTDKDLFYHIFIPRADGTKEHFRIPKGFEIGQVAGTFPERVVEAIYNGRAEPMNEVAWRFMATTFGVQIPQPVKPLIEVGMNYDTFRQRPILPFGQLPGRTPPHMRYDPYTSFVIKDIAQNMPDGMPEWLRSPKQLEYLFNGYFGPVGATILEAGDYMYRATGNAPDAPTLDISQRPVIRDYYRKNLEYSSRAIDVFYDMLTESGQVAAELKKMKEEGDSRYSEFRDKNREKTRARKALNRTSKRLSTLSKEIKEIYAHPTMDGDKKFEKIQDLQKRRNKIAQEAMEKYWEAFY